MIIVQNVQKAKSHVMINVRNEDFWKWVVEITDPPRKRIKVRADDTKLATDHNSRKEIQNIVEHNAWNN
jgi:ABC-type molybdate transport system ATPase subunit